jgi:hypothetical protein
MFSIHDPAHWFARAVAIRKIASQLADPAVKAIISKIADEYDRLAARATQQSLEERETKRRQDQIAAMRLATVGGVLAIGASR